MYTGMGNIVGGKLISVSVTALANLKCRLHDFVLVEMGAACVYYYAFGIHGLYNMGLAEHTDPHSRVGKLQ